MSPLGAVDGQFAGCNISVPFSEGGYRAFSVNSHSTFFRSVWLSVSSHFVFLFSCLIQQLRKNIALFSFSKFFLELTKSLMTCDSSFRFLFFCPSLPLSLTGAFGGDGEPAEGGARHLWPQLHPLTPQPCRTPADPPHSGARLEG